MFRTAENLELSEFRQNAAERLAQLAESGGVDILTVDGVATGVVMAPHVFDEMADKIEQAETTASIRRGLADLAAGRVRPAKQAIKNLAAQLGLTLELPPE